MCPISIGDGRRGTLGLERSRPGSVHSRRSALISSAAPELAPEDVAANSPPRASRIRAGVFAENPLVREALCRTLNKSENIAVPEAQTNGVFDIAGFVRRPVDVLVFISLDRVLADLEGIAAIRRHAPALKVLVIGSEKDDAEFLQYVRAGVSGYLWRDASAQEIAQAIENVHVGKAVCPGELCAALFRFLEDAEPRLPFGSPTQRLGLTRREQQIVPLIAKGFTNKEIANHFCLSEQTVKNHLYRMKHKIGAEDRLSIVQKFRVKGLLL